MQAEKRETNDDQDDIESNLLLPAGVTLRWATLSLKVYRAEDIPQSKTTHQSDRLLKISSGSLQIGGRPWLQDGTNPDWFSLLCFPPVDDAFVQSIKDMFGGEGSKKNLVDPFLEARFAGRKVPKTNTTFAVAGKRISLRSRKDPDVFCLCISSCALRSSRKTQTQNGTSY